MFATNRLIPIGEDLAARGKMHVDCRDSEKSKNKKILSEAPCRALALAPVVRGREDGTSWQLGDDI